MPRSGESQLLRADIHKAPCRLAIVLKLKLRLTVSTTVGGTLPFKSKAQRRKFAQLLVEGKISNKTFEEWNRETGGKQLPEHVLRHARRKAKTKSTRAKSQKRPR